MAAKKKNLSLYSENNILTNKDNPTITIGIVVSEWNEEVTSKLADGAVETLKKYGFKDENLVIKKVPGSFELPLAAQYMINFAMADAVICLGCVIQGETRHFDYVCSGLTKGIMDVSLQNEIPVAFGVLTTDNQEQALERAGGKHGNKGVEAAVAVLKMLKLRDNLVEEFEIDFDMFSDFDNED